MYMRKLLEAPNKKVYIRLYLEGDLKVPAIVGELDFKHSDFSRIKILTKNIPDTIYHLLPYQKKFRAKFSFLNKDFLGEAQLEGSFVTQIKSTAYITFRYDCIKINYIKYFKDI
jgi:hypothetical protein